MVLRRDCLKYGLAASVAAALFEPDEVAAGQFLPIPLRELVRTSSQVWLGMPVEKHSEWLDTPIGRLIVTLTRVSCEHELVAGQSHAGELWVQTLGGAVGKTGQLVHGEAKLSLGERCVLFLSRPTDRHVVNGMAQGHYAIRMSKGVERLIASPGAGVMRARPDSAVAALANRELGAAVSRIQGEAQ
jgi:hypothetical protein